MGSFLSIRPASAKSVFHAGCCPHANRIATNTQGPVDMHAASLSQGALGRRTGASLAHSVFESQGLALR